MIRRAFRLGLAAWLLSAAALAQPPRLVLGDSCFPAVMRFIGEARFRLDVEMYDLTDRQVLGALARAAGKGVEIRLLLDPGQRRNLQVPKILGDKRVSVRWMDTDQEAGQRMHAKVACADNRSLLVGSANWTYTGLRVSHECVLVQEDPSLALDFSAAFERDWAKALETWPRRTLEDEELKALPDPRRYYQSRPRLRTKVRPPDGP